MVTVTAKHRAIAKSIIEFTGKPAYPWAVKRLARKIASQESK